MSRPWHSIHWKLSSSLALALIVVLGLSFVTFYRFEEERTLQERLDVASNFSSWLANSLTFHLSRLNYYVIEEMTRSLQERSFDRLPILAVRVYDAQGALVNVSARFPADSPDHWKTEIALPIGSENAGKLEIVWSLAPMRRHLASYAMNLSVVLVLVLLAVQVTIAILLSTMLNRPIHELSEAAQRLARKDWTVRFPVHRQDEVGLMARSLDEIRRELHLRFDETEKLVQIRTEQLVQALEEQNRLNQELREKNRLIQENTELLLSLERDATLGQITASVAHELNTPIGNGVTGLTLLSSRLNEVKHKFAQGMLRRSELESFLHDCEEITQSILVNLQRASELTTSFKTVAIDQGNESPTHFDLGNYLREIGLTLMPRLKKTTHRLIIDCPEGLQLHGYPGMLATIVTNLAINALAHAWDEGQKNGLMELKVIPNGDNVRLEFRDNGRGIPPEHLERIFEPHFTTKAGKGGSGLGLSIVRNLVWRMGGDIEAISEPDRGTSFIITLPKETIHER